MDLALFGLVDDFVGSNFSLILNLSDILVKVDVVNFG